MGKSEALKLIKCGDTQTLAVDSDGNKTSLFVILLPRAVLNRKVLHESSSCLGKYASFQTKLRDDAPFNFSFFSTQRFLLLFSSSPLAGPEINLAGV